MTSQASSSATTRKIYLILLRRSKAFHWRQNRFKILQHIKNSGEGFHPSPPSPPPCTTVVVWICLYVRGLIWNWNVLIFNEQSAWLYPSILTDSLKMDYPFQRSCEQPPPPLGKNRRKGVCGRGGDCTPISSSCVKTANKKISVSSVFNESEGLSTTTVCLCLVHRPHYSARLMRFGSRGPSEFATEMPWPRLRGKTPYRD